MTNLRNSAVNEERIVRRGINQEFPSCGEGYHKALEQLQSCHGKDILIEVNRKKGCVAFFVPVLINLVTAIKREKKSVDERQIIVQNNQELFSFSRYELQDI
ncbi:hypothetical protein NPIL_275191 [Nephila pilipes]|uniref:Uncharacterized protein n=1 Tax=Nephila pilipes TaxID=299642 RepID=A0A8X6R0Q6_NEPPI|nr:hypothetical protein NPIL_275191 [Nephila pilipes]